MTRDTAVLRALEMLRRKALPLRTLAPAMQDDARDLVPVLRTALTSSVFAGPMVEAAVERFETALGDGHFAALLPTDLQTITTFLGTIPATPPSHHS